MSFRDLESGRNPRDITPDDATVYDPPLRSLYIGGTGDVVVVAPGQADGDAATFTGYPAGQWLPVKVAKVMAATTATDIIGVE